MAHRKLNSTPKEARMALYMYQAAYTPESLAAQMKNPQDRLKVVEPLFQAAGGKIITGGFSFGEYDVTAIYEAPDDASAAAISVAVAAGGAVKAAKTTRLLSGTEWIQALSKASSIGGSYRPAR
jgi:uncharacterized protein with GYD domain